MYQTNNGEDPRVSAYQQVPYRTSYHPEERPPPSYIAGQPYSAGPLIVGNSSPARTACCVAFVIGTRPTPNQTFRGGGEWNLFSAFPDRLKALPFLTSTIIQAMCLIGHIAGVNTSGTCCGSTPELISAHRPSALPQYPRSGPSYY